MLERKPLATAHGLTSSRFFRPILEALRDLGGTAESEEIYDWIAKHYAVPQAELTGKIQTGITKFENYVRWSCSMLVQVDLAVNERRNLWSLTKKGRETNLSDEAAARLYREIRNSRKGHGTNLPSRAEVRPYKRISPFREALGNLMKGTAMRERKPLATAHGLASSRFFRPALEALRDLGGRAASEDIYDWIAKRYAVPQDELTEKIETGITRFENYVRWSCSMLVQSGLVADEGHNLWSLTKRGRETNLSDEDAARLYREIRHRRKDKRR